MALGGGLWALAQAPAGEVFRDRAGWLTLWNMSSHEVVLSPKGPVVFDGAGKPLRGKSEKQGLDFTARTLKAELEPGPKDSYLLKTADLGGSVVINMVKAEAGVTVTRSLTTDRAKIEDSPSQGRIQVLAPFQFKQATSGGTNDGGELSASGSRGEFLMTSLREAKSELRSATLEGNVEAVFKFGASKGQFSSQKLNLIGYPKSAVTMPSPFVFKGQRQSEDGAVIDTLFKGASGSAQINFLAKDRDVLEEMTISGGADITLIQKKAGETRTVKAKAPEMVYSRSAGTLTLNGGVTYSADVEAPDKPSIGGEGQSRTLVITFNEKGEIVDYRAKSGETTITRGEKP
jgi:hypothetical protein